MKKKKNAICVAKHIWHKNEMKISNKGGGQIKGLCYCDYLPNRVANFVIVLIIKIEDVAEN